MKKSTKMIIFLLFFASGISGLIYEVVWLRILSRVIGVTTYATSVTLAAFMAGLAIGSFMFGKFIDKRKDQLRIYALLQLAVAVTAVLVPPILKIAIPFYKHVYIMSHENTTLIAILKLIVSFISLLIPATLMGGTLPVLTSYLVKREGLFGKNFSLLYGINTLGAVLGVVLSGFVTLGALGEWNTIFIGVLINIIVGALALLLYNNTVKFIEEDKAVVQADTPISPYSDFVRKVVLISILISGFTALAYEVIWTRQLILFLETSIYAFSGMLAVFLAGIAIGSIIMNKYLDGLKAPLIVFGTLELIIGILSILNLHLFAFLDNNLLSKLLSPVVLVFPLTFFFGAIFPLASLCYAKSINRSGFSVGAVYGFNTIGNVAGSILTGFLFISLLGSSRTIILLGFLNVAIGLTLLWLEPNRSSRFKMVYLLVIPIAISFSLGLIGKDPFLGVIEKRIQMMGAEEGYKIFHNKETVEGTVTAYAIGQNKIISVNGYGQSVLCTETKIITHLPVMLAKEPKKLLIICFGLGTTARSACIYDGLDITTVELVPEEYKCFKYFHDDAEEILRQKKFHPVAGDGRNYLLLSPEKYDIISIDPSPPIYAAGTVNLYSQEFLLLCKEHLTKDGAMCLWFPGGPEDDSKAIIKTFYSIFPNMSLWLGPRKWGFYMIGTLTKIEIDKLKIEKAFTNPKLLKDLSEYDNTCATSSQLLSLLALKDKNTIENLTKDSVIITDNFPYTEFPLWRYMLKESSTSQ